MCSSTTRWKLVPPKPKELIPARRTSPSFFSHGRATVFTRKGKCEKSMLGLGRSKLIEGGSTCSRNAKIVLSSAAAPAALLRWPMLDFTEPSAIFPVGRSSAPKIEFRLLTSTTSPTRVDVPCPSINAALRGSRPALRQARSMARCCPTGLGAVMPLPLPSLLLPTPRITA